MRFRPSMLMLLAAAAAILPRVSLAAEVEDEDEANAIEDDAVDKTPAADVAEATAEVSTTTSTSTTPHPLRVRGSSRWRDRGGVQVTLRYEADENGYRAWGTGIPSLDDLPPLLRAGIILNLKVAEQRKARGLDMPPRFKRMRERRQRGELPPRKKRGPRRRQKWRGKPRRRI